jgi:hypothetical protein
LYQPTKPYTKPSDRDGIKSSSSLERIRAY